MNTFLRCNRATALAQRAMRSSDDRMLVARICSPSHRAFVTSLPSAQADSYEDALLRRLRCAGLADLRQRQLGVAIWSRIHTSQVSSLCQSRACRSLAGLIEALECVSYVACAAGTAQRARSICGGGPGTAVCGPVHTGGYSGGSDHAVPMCG